MAQPLKPREKRGSSAPLLLVVLLVLVGLSVWNYRRNVALETQVEPSPYSGLSTADLDALIGAYQSEIAALQAQGRAGRRTSARDNRGVSQGVREFERVQRSSRSAREAGYAISEREGALRALEQERARRGEEAPSGTSLFLRRAFSVSL